MHWGVNFIWFICYDDWKDPFRFTFHQQMMFLETKIKTRWSALIPDRNCGPELNSQECNNSTSIIPQLFLEWNWDMLRLTYHSWKSKVPEFLVHIWPGLTFLSVLISSLCSRNWLEQELWKDNDFIWYKVQWNNGL